jgi:pimeloyl-ACP methyl ester carboxylesterase
MRERALKFGKTANLVGILTQPGPEQESADRPAVLLLNSGILHRAGASRLYVQIARELAGRGFTCLRFDFSGIGDSEARRDTLPFHKSAVLETQEAMDFLAQARGFKQFILIGLCSGADMSFWVSLEDERVIGLAQLDAFAYRTRGYKIRHYGPRLVNPLAWKRSAEARIRNYIAAKKPKTDDELASVYVAPEYRRVFPPRERVAQGLQQLMQRGVQLYYFFSGSMADHINYRAQYEESFPDVDFGRRLHVEYVNTADHTVTQLDKQQHVVGAIGDWAETRFAAAAAPEPVLAGR